MPSSSSFAACTSWPKAPTCSAARISRSSFPISRPAARWPTWPRRISSSSAGPICTRCGTTSSAGRQACIPVTYINSAASIKAFCGEHGGVVCTSGNAAGTLKWAWERGEKILFLPDQHLGRNTAYRMGVPLDQMVVWDPNEIWGGLEPEAVKNARIILWKGHCSVHARFTVRQIENIRAQHPGVRVIVHPEVPWDVLRENGGA